MAPSMLANLLHLFGARPDPEYDQAFIRDVRIRRRRARDRRVEHILAWGWLLIVIKSIVVWWACTKYAVPFHPFWVIGPTIAFAALCTAIYLGRR
jgi:hypothetical protein